MSYPRDDLLVWMDLEMTGLDPARCVILEVAAVVTDSELAPVAPGLDLAVRPTEDDLARMEDWSREHHTESGLIERVRVEGLPLRQAADELLAYLRRLCMPGTAPLCGNSVWQDRRFLIAYMPDVNALLHYRIIDVSSVKELVRRWYGEELHFPAKNNSHRALGDIHESIAELRYYRDHVFRPAGPASGREA
jgi:oligoribonuclease